MKKETPTLELPIFSAAGERVETAALPETLFAAPWRADLVHQVVTGMQANKRQSRAHTKDRSEVAGGGKKPWKQKGTGQARHGSTRSPIWRHGGITFGPRTDRNYGEKINRKMRAQALASVLTRKFHDGEVILVNELGLSSPKTSFAKKVISALAKSASAETLATKRANAAVVALPSYDANAIKSFRNFGNVMTEEARNLNPVDVLTHKYLIIVAPGKAFSALEARVKAK